MTGTCRNLGITFALIYLVHVQSTFINRTCKKRNVQETLKNAKISSNVTSFSWLLRMENCVDYLTEKYWGTPLELGVVPVVMGGANYSQMAIPGSYINVLDFDSVKDLADYLLYLDKNDTAYMEYFAWRKTYRVYGYLKGAVFNEHYPWTCNMCAKAQNPGSKSYGSLSDYRNPSTLCELNEDKLYDMVRPGGDTGFMNRYTQQNEIYGVDENPTDDEEGEDEEGEEEEGDEEGEDEEDEDEDEDVNGEEAVTGERVKELVKREKM